MNRLDCGNRGAALTRPLRYQARTNTPWCWIWQHWHRPVRFVVNTRVKSLRKHKQVNLEPPWQCHSAPMKNQDTCAWAPNPRGAQGGKGAPKGARKPPPHRRSPNRRSNPREEAGGPEAPRAAPPQAREGPRTGDPTPPRKGAPPETPTPAQGEGRTTN